MFYQKDRVNGDPSSGILKAYDFHLKFIIAQIVLNGQKLKMT